MTEQTQTDLKAQALEIIRSAETEISTIINIADDRAAEIVAQGRRPDQIEAARAEAQQVMDDARKMAESIAKAAEDQVLELVRAAGEEEDEEAAQLLAMHVRSAIDNPGSGIRFSEHLEKTDKTGDPVPNLALAVEGTLDAIMTPFLNKIETSLEHADTPHLAADHHHVHSDTTVILGREITVPGGIYTVVFVVLALLTVFEIIIAEVGLPSGISVPILAAASLAKAVLVVMFYMHLREDSRFFTYAVIIPLAMVSMIIVFLLIMPPFGY